MGPFSRLQDAFYYDGDDNGGSMNSPVSSCKQLIRLALNYHCTLPFILHLVTSNNKNTCGSDENKEGY
jgi:hypothetical protein